MCSRCKDEAVYWYQKKNVKNSEYYINILKKIKGEKKLNSNVHKFLIEIQEILKRRIIDGLQPIKDKFNQLESYSSREQQKIQDFINDLKNETLKLQRSIENYQQIDETTTIGDKLTTLINDSLAWFRNKVSKWNSITECEDLEDLIDQTRVAISLFAVFGNEKSIK